MTRSELEARIAKISETFLYFDDWLMTVAIDFPNDLDAKTRCTEAHSALAQLHRVWSARLKKERGR